MDLAFENLLEKIKEWYPGNFAPNWRKVIRILVKMKAEYFLMPWKDIRQDSCLRQIGAMLVECKKRLARRHMDLAFENLLEKIKELYPDIFAPIWRDLNETILYQHERRGN